MQRNDSYFSWYISSVQSLSPVQLFATLCTAASQASPPITSSQSLLKLCPSSQWCHPTTSFSVGLLPPSVFPSVRVFPSEWVRIRWHWNFSFSFIISPSNEYSGLISFRMDWLDLLAVHGTLKSLLQRHGSKASILWPSTFFIVQLSHLYMTTEKIIALTRLTFVGKVMFLLFIMLSKLVITFLPRGKHLLISWLQSPSAVLLDPQKIKSATVSPSICYEVMRQDAIIFVF